VVAVRQPVLVPGRSRGTRKRLVRRRSQCGVRSADSLCGSRFGQETSRFVEPVGTIGGGLGTGVCVSRSGTAPVVLVNYGFLIVNTLYVPAKRLLISITGLSTFVPQPLHWRVRQASATPLSPNAKPPVCSMIRAGLTATCSIGNSKLFAASPEIDLDLPIGRQATRKLLDSFVDNFPHGPYPGNVFENKTRCDALVRQVRILPTSDWWPKDTISATIDSQV
jgi:hypothetical protein